jgi:hypothetical protein
MNKIAKKILIILLILGMIGIFVVLPVLQAGR